MRLSPLSITPTKPAYEAVSSLRLSRIRECLLDRNLRFKGDHLTPESYNAGKSHLYITIFESGRKSIRWGATRENFSSSVNRVIDKLLAHPRFLEFSISDFNKCRILIEYTTSENEYPLKHIQTNSFDDNRFEPGIDGLKYVYDGITRYFMPTDAFTESIMTKPQLLNYIAKKIGIAGLSDKISERITIIGALKIDCFKINSYAEITYKDSTYPLYRGLPQAKSIDHENIYYATISSGDWLVNNQNTDGSFKYFYDPIRDSDVDFQHPCAINPLYSNILRHSGATITLIMLYEITADIRYIESAKKSADYFLTTLKWHQTKYGEACFPFFNKKSKLGGAGIGLVSLMRLYNHGYHGEYSSAIVGLVAHIRSRITSDGEMIGYYLHPLVNSGRPIENPSDELKRTLFSFYYPGEALLGLAMFLRHYKDIDVGTRKSIMQECTLCLDFLIDKRPIKYADLFTPLPADSWLMQAIEELIKIKGICKSKHVDFVFNDASAMCDHMYMKHNSPYEDYTGGFYYQYGDHVYQDASRCEGLIAAYELAKYLDNQKLSTHYRKHIGAAAKGVFNTWYCSESTYCHKHSEKAFGSFRFKLTRQWIRVDSNQHAVCFYCRLLESEISRRTEPVNDSA